MPPPPLSATAVLPPDLEASLRGRLSPGAAVRGSVVSVADAADVVATVRLAGRHGVAVAGGGDGADAARGLVVDVDGLGELSVSEAGWARVGGGVRWRQLAAAAARHGLAPVPGTSGDERVADAVTGGGVGLLARTYGPASDRVRAVELVTGDGVLRRAAPDEEPELFWGVRGGGAALGLVTAVEVDLLAAGPRYAGDLSWPGDDAGQVLEEWRTWSAALPPQAGTSLVLVRLPTGEVAVSVRFGWTGDPGDGAAVLDGLRARLRPARDDVGVRGPADLGGGVGPVTGVESSLLLDRLGAAGAGPVLRAATGGCAPRTVELRLLGGAVGWVPERSSALCHRDARLAVRVVGGTGTEDRAATWACAEELAAALDPETGGREPAHGHGRWPDVLARTPTPPVRDRLTALATATDPHRILEGAGRGRPPVPGPGTGGRPVRGG
ncbi:FAD/FMN-containing dehydrogenase [Geodermatophilus bullaregiensis]|uniref:FAD-binding oxidoreductase n=1 Tax=Geodermatophilus bullaregiensis TaxID=1564160 RepID=UPI00195B0784|nr:FAD-binding protein [Geodermatophilus bullaregiensis]MBM7808909.1 FAD/FMN-containing dehydrogenase [Geodermatophilus bullaregiensis]